MQICFFPFFAALVWSPNSRPRVVQQTDDAEASRQARGHRKKIPLAHNPESIFFFVCHVSVAV